MVWLCCIVLFFILLMQKINGSSSELTLNDFLHLECALDCEHSKEALNIEYIYIRISLHNFIIIWVYSLEQQKMKFKTEKTKHLKIHFNLIIEMRSKGRCLVTKCWSDTLLRIHRFGECNSFSFASPFHFMYSVCLLGIANAYASMGQNDGKLCHDSAATTIKKNKEVVNRSETNYSQKLSLEQRSKRRKKILTNPKKKTRRKSKNENKKNKLKKHYCHRPNSTLLYLTIYAHIHINFFYASFRFSQFGSFFFHINILLDFYIFESFNIFFF